MLDRAEPSDARTVRTGLRKIVARQLDRVGQRRAAVPQGDEPGPDPHGPRRGPTRRGATRRRARQAGRARPAAGARPRQPAGAVRRPPTRPGCSLWQDLPLQWGYARGTRKQAVRQAREAVDLLAHHPSIALWCAHNEPLTIDVEPGAAMDLRATARKTVAGMVLPSWNKTVLDSSLRRALEKADKSRPVIAHSGLADRRQPPLLRLVPRRRARPARGPRACGRGSAGSSASSARRPCPSPPTSWTRRRGPTWTGTGSPAPTPSSTCSSSATTSTRRASPRSTSGRDATQAYQANLLRRHVETLRRLKYRPAGGFAQFCFADGHPAVTWSVLDHERRPKLGLRRAASGVRAGHRRRRPSRRAPTNRARRSPSTSTSCPIGGRPSTAWSWRRRCPGRAASTGDRGPATCPPTRASASPRCRSSCPTRRADSPSTSPCPATGVEASNRYESEIARRVTAE